MTEKQIERFIVTMQQCFTDEDGFAIGFSHDDIQALTRAIRSIASGNNAGPDGLELVSMSLGGANGKPGETSVYDGLVGVAQAIQDHATAIEGLCETIKEVWG